MHRHPLGQQEPDRDALAGGGVVVPGGISDQEQPVTGDPARALVEEPGGERSAQRVGSREQRQRLSRRPGVVTGDSTDGAVATEHRDEQLLGAHRRLVPLMAAGEADRDPVDVVGVNPPVAGETVPPVSRCR